MLLTSKGCPDCGTALKRLVLKGHGFNRGSDGTPNSVAADQAGNVYATARFIACFGASNANVFQFSPPAWDPVVLKAFTLDYRAPLSSWVSTDASGNVYGTTNQAGGAGGNVFKLTCCWNYTDLHDFPGEANDGTQPMAAPVVDAQGNIYGTTTSGGTYGQGVVWEITP